MFQRGRIAVMVPGSRPGGRRRVTCAFVAVAAVAALAWASPRAGAQTYHTHAEIGQDLLAAETAYPALCKRYDLGQSVQGRSLWALRISDNVGVEEDEPEFKYISTMHGDEITGVEMCMNLVDYLTSNYGSDSRVTNIVDEVDLWIVPLMNPDGYELANRTRGNANGTDLNRNFPDLGDANTTGGRAPETAAIMDWSAANSFVASANFHGGAKVVNYPFDNELSGSRYTPDNDLFVWMSEEYSWYNQLMWNGAWFHGITNGVDWYAIDGGMQDWNYHFMGCNEVTIELSDNKEPPFSQIPGFWEDNRDSMLAYIETCLVGVRGVVTDAFTGEPLAATVTVVGRNHEIYTDPDVGDYHRMLLPGTYDIQFEVEEGSVIETDVVVLPGPATRLDVGVYGPARVSSPNGGEQLSVGAPNSVTWTGNPAAQFHIQYAANSSDSSLTADGFETGTLDPAYNSGGHASWFVTESDQHGGSWSARAGSIGSSEVSWLMRSVGGGNLSFWYRVSSGGGDVFNFYVGGSLELQQSGETGWTYFTAALPGENNTLVWEYVKDGGTSGGSDTVWIDDLEISADLATWTNIAALTATGASSAAWTPTVLGSDYKVRVRAYYGSGNYGKWDESDQTFSVVEGTEGIPAVSTWGMLLMMLLTLVAGTIVYRRPCSATAPATGVTKNLTHPRRRSTALGLLILLGTGPYSLAGDIVDIHAAARIGDVQRLDVLLASAPSSVNSTNARGETPLHQAVRGLHAEAAGRLLAAGAAVNARNGHGATPLSLAIYLGGEAKEVKAQREAMVALLLDNKADVGVSDDQGKTVLHVAALKNRVELLDRLKTAGAKIVAKDSLGRTPLHDAATANHTAVIKWLLKGGAKVNVVDASGETPLHHAARRFRKEATVSLIAAGAEVDVRNAAGATPLHVAALAGPEVVEVDRLLAAVATVLIRNGADVNAADARGVSPLRAAIDRGHENLAELLRRSGARE